MKSAMKFFRKVMKLHNRNEVQTEWTIFQFILAAFATAVDTIKFYCLIAFYLHFLCVRCIVHTTQCTIIGKQYRIFFYFYYFTSETTTKSNVKSGEECIRRTVLRVRFTRAEFDDNNNFSAAAAAYCLCSVLSLVCACIECSSASLSICVYVQFTSRIKCTHDAFISFSFIFCVFIGWIYSTTTTLKSETMSLYLVSWGCLVQVYEPSVVRVLDLESFFLQ